MIAGKSYSLANPILGSAAFSDGLRAASSFATLSVGTQIDPSTPYQYVRQPANGDDVTVTIKSGVITFSHPQSHPYVGIGDTVVFTDGQVATTVYLNKKISTRKWEVRGGSSFGAPDDVIEAQTLVKIDKTFPGIREAIDGSTSGALAIIGNSVLASQVNAVALRCQLRIAMYEMSEEITTDAVALVSVDGWTTDEECCVKIFCPSDIKSECNSDQRHKYVLDKNNDKVGISLVSNYTIIQSLCFDGHSRSDNKMIDYNSTTLSKTKILDCRFYDCGYGITSTETPADNQVIKGNTFYDIAFDAIVMAHSRVNIYSNTIVSCAGFGIHLTGNTGTCRIVNNLVQGCDTDSDIVAYSQSDDIACCIVDDNSIPNNAGNMKNTTVLFKNAAAKDYRLDVRAINPAIISGSDLSEDAYYAFNTDAFGNKIDESWSIGSHHFVRELRLAAGYPSTTDLKTDTSPLTASMSEMGLLTFSEPQVNENLCAGCVVTLFGGVTVLLWEMVDSSNWKVTDTTTPGRGDFTLVGSLSVLSIKVAFEGVYSALTQGIAKPYGDGDILDYLSTDTSIDAVTDDIKIVLNCSYGDVNKGAEINGSFDETRNITVKAPNLPGVDCNISRRHNGKFDNSKFYIQASSNIFDGFSIYSDFVTIDGMQIYAINNGVSVVRGHSFSIINNIISGAGDDGIKIQTGEESERSIIVNNIIYGCVGAGIDVFQGAFTAQNSHLAIYNNTIICKGQGIYIYSLPDVGVSLAISIKNNLVQGFPTVGVGLIEMLKSTPDYQGKNYQITNFSNELMSIDSCWSEDDSTTKYGGFNNGSALRIRFRDRAADDYRITFSDSLLMENAEELSADGFYNFDNDIKNSNRSIIKWNVGADNFSVSSAKESHFSVGINTQNLDPDSPGRTATISDSIITFDGDGISAAVGVGDKVEFAYVSAPMVTLYCYLAEKGNNKIWVIRTNEGSQYPSEGPIVVASIKRVSDTLENALDVGGTEKIYNELGGTTKDIGSIFTKVFVWCYNDGADTSAGPVIDGWNGSIAYPMIVSVPWDIATQCNTRQRHFGVWSVDSFSLSPATGDGFTISSPCVHIDGFQIECSNGDNGILCNQSGTTAGNNLIKNNLIRDTKNGIYIDSTFAIAQCAILNNIIYGTFETGIYALNGYVYNNTIVSPSVLGVSGLAAASGELSVINCLVTGAPSSGCFAINKLNAGFYNCISQDTTANGTNCVANVVGINFADAANDDYHLRRDDWVALNYGMQLKTSFVWFEFNSDIDLEALNGSYDGYTNWSIGADSNPNMETVKLYFSASAENTADLSEPSTKVYISGGSMVFDTPQDNDNLGIGDEVTYDTNKVCYLYQKISTTQWLVRTKYGLNPDDIGLTTPVDLETIKHKFNATDIEAFLTTVRAFLSISPTNFTDLIKAKYQINFPFYKSTSKIGQHVYIYGFVTNEDCYFRLYTPDDTINECNTRQRYKGWYQAEVHTDAVVFEPPDTLYDHPEAGYQIQVSQNYTVIEGVVINAKALTYTSNNGINILESVGCKIIGCTIIEANFGILSLSDFYLVLSYRKIIANNIIIRPTVIGIQGGGDDIMYNNTIICSGAYFGFMNFSADILINNIVQGAASQDYYTPNFVTYCLSSDASAGTGEGCIINSQILFATYGIDNDDYHLSASDSVARGSGKQLVYNSNYKLSVDASNLPRGKRWDLGALEFETRHVYYSVGLNPNNLKSNPLGVLGFEITNYVGDRPVEGYSIITFSSDQIDVGVGVGCEITSTNSDDFPDGCFISGKIDYKNWYVTDKSGYAIPYGSGEVSSIRRAYATLGVAIDEIFTNKLSSDLIGEQVQVSIACYKDYPDSSTATVYFLNCDSDFNLIIYAPTDTEHEVNSNQSHGGDPSNGYKILGNYNDTESNWSIKVIGTSYVEIEGLVVMSPYNIKSNGIWIDYGKNYYLSKNIVHGCTGDGIKTSQPLPQSLDFIVNNLVFNCSGDGISTGSKYDSSGSKTFIYNNTVYKCFRGIHFWNNADAQYSSILGICINNICQESLLKDYVEEYPALGMTLQISYCTSSDDTANFYGGSINDTNKIVQFIDKVGMNFNLLPQVDYSAIDNGRDLSDISIIAFADDIQYKNREPGMWDRGAFEIVSISGSGELTAGPVGIEGICFASKTIPILELHLRKEGYELPDVENFYSIDVDGILGRPSINTFLAANSAYKSYSIVVYVQGGESFAGQFVFGPRTGAKTVIVKTWPAEEHLGPASILYEEYLVDATSKQSVLTFEDLKLYCGNNTYDNNYMIITAGATQKLRFIQCIVQINRDAIVDITDCVVQVVSSILIYRNKYDQDNMYLANNDLISGNYMYNSMVLSYRTSDLEFQLSRFVCDDIVSNCLSYNYSNGGFAFTNPSTKVINCLQDTDPFINEFSLTTRLFDISTVMVSPFMLDNDSPAINAGDNLLVETSTDIGGNDRIFNFGVVDIGPRESEIHHLEFKSQSIASVFQDKIFINFETKECFFAESDLVLKDFYHQFDGSIGYREEFIRESKIVITLKSVESDFSIKTDKIDTLVNSFEAYYDANAMAIIIKKDAKIFGNLFSNIFLDGRFIFEFDEITHTLSVYINDTYNKGASGDKNPVKNVKFGGTALVLK